MFPLKKASEAKLVPDALPNATLETKPSEQEPEKQLNEKTVTEQSTVHNNNYGDGVVRKIEDDKIYVDFKSGQRIYPYPDALEKGWLTL